MTKILVVDDEPKLGRIIAEMLEVQGYHVTLARGGKAALDQMEASVPDVIVTDLRMPDVDGMEVLRRARAMSSPPDVIVMTAFGTTDNAVAAMRLGAADYLTKPFAMDELRMRVARLAEQRRSAAQVKSLLNRVTPPPVAVSAKMQHVLEDARKVAASDASVLLLGESGTGKSRIARFIHYESARAEAPLVEVHCAALPEALLESELFGYEKGAFTGATARKDGLLQSARMGTLFLDEIGDISPPTQLKLLRFLQEREFVPLGSTVAETVDVRIVAATNRDLEAAVADGSFREDLYYRLNVFTITVPPLRERREDLDALSTTILERRGLPPSKLGASARAVMASHSWLGNVRELENVLERAIILSGPTEIAPEHLGLRDVGTRTRDLVEMPKAGTLPSAVPPASLLVEGFNLDAFERDLIHAAIDLAGGNKAKAARLLGITRRRLYSRLKTLAETSGETPGETSGEEAV
ncbi:MAG: sigma-54-dependent Fis family transcriptional regulator [Deltaproteobacteria bacterium]|nr:sigma-54-dependent Fis family transcriptional regulator [Deltaproteobacteria bacterium]